jgi:DNA-binding transcriptional MerR regulator
MTLDSLASSAGIHPDLVRQFLEFGLIEPVERVGDRILFDLSSVSRLQKIQRLRRDTGVNLAGIAIILDLVDRLYALQRENELLLSRLNMDGTGGIHGY